MAPTASEVRGSRGRVTTFSAREGPHRVAGVRCGSGLVCTTSRAGRLSNGYRYMYWLVTAGFGRKLDTMEAVERVPIFALQVGSAACALYAPDRHRYDHDASPAPS
jgi:hypothetical protein